MSSPRSVAILILAVLLGLATTAEASSNPVQGRWTAQLPGGALSYYHFKAGTVEPDGNIQGRFVHMYLDVHGAERLVHGTYVLAPFGPWGKWGKLTLLFDNGLQIKDIEPREPGVLKLHHVGLGHIVTYFRQ
jgi:hypothetical protein